MLRLRKLDNLFSIWKLNESHHVVPFVLDANQSLVKLKENKTIK